MTEPRQQGRTRGSVPLWTVLTGAVTAAAYWGFLGWDQQKDTDPLTGNQTGPFQAWQVAGLVLVLAVLAFAAGLRGRPWLASIVVAVVLTVSFALDAATDVDADGLWPIGAALVTLGSLLGTALVAGAGALLARRRTA
ncbi:hypothetical protein [Plantactinospora sp. CA-290183]|uniref:hypothetical protein n=1 Tax=Plantactinospora sp. CA-290183 TaxID=3240006 RepID=UPI003D94B976